MWRCPFGSNLIDFALSKFHESKDRVGCRMVRLDCSEDLVPYYRGHGFQLIRKAEDGEQCSMMMFI